MSYEECRFRQVLVVTTRESCLFTLDFTRWLATGETISAVSGTSGGYTLGVTADVAVTVGTPAVNTGTVTDEDGNTIAVGKAVQVRLAAASGVVGTVYEIVCLVSTTDGNRYEGKARLQVVS